MQGQKGAIGSSPDGSTSSDSGVVEQQIRWANFIRGPPTNTNQETPNLTMWSMGESSSSSVMNNAGPYHEPLANMLSLGDANSGNHHLGHNVTVNPSTFIGVNPSNYASSSSSSGPFEMEARQRPCKRKAAELTIGQSSSGIISSSVFQKGSNDNNGQLNLISSDPIIPRPGPVAGGVFPDNHAADNRRNVRIRINNSRQQDPLPVNGNSNITGQLNFSSPYPSLGLNPVVTTGESSSSQDGRRMLRVPAIRRNPQVTSRNRSSSSRANRPASLNIIGGSGDNSRTMPTNISDHPLFVQPHDIRNPAQTAINWNLNSSGGNGNGNGNATNNGNNGLASTANAGANSGPRHGSSTYSSRRLSDALRWSLLSSIDSGGGGGGQNGNLFARIPPPVGTLVSSSQESGIPPVIGIAGHHPLHHHIAHLRSTDRQLDGVYGYPHVVRNVAGGSERRGRIAEIRNVLELIRRGENLRFEDVMVLDQSVFYGMAGIHDRHRDMRLDIDNMSYEELLALEERIGNVNTGLTEEKVSKCLKQKTYASVTGQPDAEPCCICQEEYADGDELGALDCGHDFHTSCIKQWLLQKNLCPVCKSTASK
ncbi:putative transcription factor C2H2 family [Helianthus annuus]|nr:putative transcription factor C2H2 family [Helianthus annuus]